MNSISKVFTQGHDKLVSRLRHALVLWFTRGLHTLHFLLMG